MNKLALAGLLAVSMVGVAAAMPPQAAEIKKIDVVYSDLNVNRPAGARALYRRIEVAATRVCGKADVRRLTMKAEHTACYEQAVYNAVQDLDMPLLTAYHEGTLHAGSDAAPVRVAEGARN